MDQSKFEKDVSKYMIFTFILVVSSILILFLNTFAITSVPPIFITVALAILWILSIMSIIGMMIIVLGCISLESMGKNKNMNAKFYEQVYNPMQRRYTREIKWFIPTTLVNIWIFVTLAQSGQVALFVLAVITIVPVYIVKYKLVPSFLKRHAPKAQSANLKIVK